MADNEVKIKVSTETDTAPLEEMDDLVEDIQENANVKVDVDDSSVEEATDKTGELSDKLDDVDSTTANPEVDADSADEAMDKFDELIGIMEEINDKIVKPEVDTSDIEKANEDLKETDDSLGNIKTALVGLVATAEIENMATTADNINTSWNRLKLTFDGTNVTMDVLKDKVSQVSSETSRGAGLIRDYFNQMGVAGVTNVDLLADSFEALSGKAYQLDSDVGSLEAKMQRMVLTGSASEKMLASLGITAQDLANAIGVSVDELSEAFDNLSPEQRLQAITTAMGDGTLANQMYADSYDAVKEKAERAMSGLEGAVGEAILPTMIPAFEGATTAVQNLTQMFKNLPEPVQNAIGTTMGVAAIGTTAIGAFGEVAGSIANLGDAYGVLKDVYRALIPVQEAEAVAGTLSVGWIALAILLGIALGLAFIYLYENCDWFREGVDNLAATLQNIVEVISGAVMGALQWLQTEFQNFTSQLGINTQNWIQAVLAFILFLPTLPARVALELANALAKALGFKTSFVQTITSAVTNAVNNFKSIIDGIATAIQSCLDWANSIIMNHPIVQTIIWLGQQMSWAFSVLGLGQSSPGKIVKAMRQELDWTSEAIAKSDLARDTENLGAGMAEAFNPNLNVDGSAGVIAAGGFAGGDTIINVYGDVDSDKRVQEIVDAVRRELSWNNATAGRTV